MGQVEAEMNLENGEIEIVVADTNCVRAAALLVQEVTPVSSTVPTEAADGVVPVVRASGIPGKWKRAEPVGISPKLGSVWVRHPQYP